MQTILLLSCKIVLNMENERTLSPKESLELIADVISKTKEDIKQHSFIFMLWGWLLVIASVARYAIQHYSGFEYFFIPYPIMAAVGITLSAIFYWRKKTERTETYLSYYIKRLWMISTLGFLAVVGISISQHVAPAPYTLVIAGIGTLVTGVILKFRPLQLGGLIIFASAVICALLPNDYKDLIHGGAFLLGFLVPGYILKSAKA